MSASSVHILDWFDHLRRLTIERIEAAYLRARRSRVAEPAVLVLDLSDPAGRRIMSAARSEDEAEQFYPAGRTPAGAPLALWHMPGAVAADLLREDQVTVRVALQDWANYGPVNTFPAVLVSVDFVYLAICSIPKR